MIAIGSAYWTIPPEAPIIHAYIFDGGDDEPEYVPAVGQEAGIWICQYGF
jgi:hypothetical protein